LRLSRGFYAAYLISLVAALVLVTPRNLTFKPGPSLIVAVIAITVAVLFTICLAFWTIFRSLRLRQKSWNSYELVLDGDRLIKRMTDGDDLIVHRSEVSGFDETAGRGFFVKTQDVHRYIFVPSALNDYDELKRELASWRPFPRARARDPIWSSPFFIGSVCLLAWWMLWFSANKQHVLAAAFVLLVFLISTFVAVMRSPRASIGMKRMSWIYLVVAGLTLVRVAAVMRVTE